VVAAIHAPRSAAASKWRSAPIFRVATKDAKLGLPEVKLGLLPGAGGHPAAAACGRSRALRSR